MRPRSAIPEGPLLRTLLESVLATGNAEVEFGRPR
jgi:hypothetical protein